MKKLIVLSTMLALSTPLMASVDLENHKYVAPMGTQATQSKSVNLIVKFKDNTVHKSLLSTPETTKVLMSKSGSMDVSSFKRKYNIQSNVSREVGVQRLSSMSQRHGVDFNHVRSMSLGADVINVSSESAIKSQQLILDMMDSGDFESVSVDFVVKQMSYNDPKFEDQKHLMAYSPINPYGQNYVSMRNNTVNNLGRSLKVGIIDSGGMVHEDINDMVGGYDWVDGDTDPTDETPANGDIASCHNGHGSSVAGLIAAISNNGLGVTGTMNSDDVDLYHARTLDCAGNGFNSNIIDAVSYFSNEPVPGIPTLDTQVDVINMSLGGVSLSGCSYLDQEVYTNAREKGILVVVAAGNENLNVDSVVPASCNDIVTVGATTHDGDKATFSNYGDKVDVLAAGDSVWMINDKEYFSGQNGYFQGSGTSMSTPNIVGGAGNLMLTYPDLTPDQIENMLKANGRGYADNTVCGQLGCGAGAVDMGQLMTAIPNVTTNASYNKVHRYEGYNDPKQAVWLTEMDKYASSCDMIKYTWGQLGVAMAGVEYKLYMSENGGEMTFMETVSSPEKVYSHSQSTLIGVQTCKDGTCGDIVQMRGTVNAPSSCQ